MILTFYILATLWTAWLLMVVNFKTGNNYSWFSQIIVYSRTLVMNRKRRASRSVALQWHCRGPYFFFEPGTYTVILVCKMMLVPAKAPMAAGSTVRHWSVAHSADRVSYTGRTLPLQEWGRPSCPTTSSDAFTSDTLSGFQDGTNCHTKLLCYSAHSGATSRYVWIAFPYGSAQLFCVCYMPSQPICLTDYQC